MITHYAAPKSISIDQIENEISKDIILEQVIESIQTNNWSRNLQLFYTIHHQLSVYRKVLLKNHQIVIPKKLQHLILQIAHSQHQGIQKTKNLLRQKVWWPESLTAIAITRTPQNNWKKLAVDLEEPLPSGESILVITD